MKAWASVVVLVLFSSTLLYASTDPSRKEDLGVYLRVAAREGRIKEVQRLLDDGADPNVAGEYGETALMNAARFNQRQVVDLLLDHHAEVNSRDSGDDTALEKAAKNCSYRVGEALIARDADVNWINSEGQTALITATQQGCIQLVQALLHVRGIRLNQKDNSGTTALDYAFTEAQIEVGGPYTEIAKLLHKAGAKTAQWQVPAEASSPRSSEQSRKLP